jgi:hypothetical protein
VGHVDNAVMLQARLKPGMLLMDILLLTRSLGQKVADEPETWVWTDAGGDRVRVELRDGRSARGRSNAPADRLTRAAGTGRKIAPCNRTPEDSPMSMADRDGKIWMDGSLVEWRDAKIHVLTHTLHYGCGAFEGVRAYNTARGTAIFRLREHTERLFNSAKILRMKIPFTLEQVMQAQRDVVRANKLESCYLRPLTWIGSRSSASAPRATPST